MMMMVLVSKQHIVTTKYNLQTTPHFSIHTLSVGRRNYHTKMKDK